MKELRHAIALLTIFPVKSNGSASVASTFYYPVVGVLLSLCLSLVWLIFPIESPLVLSSLLVVLLIVLTGGLHLDGLADCVDGLFAYHGDRDRLKRVMKSPEIGSMGAVALFSVLLVKTVCLTEILINERLMWLALIIPIISRSLAASYMHLTEYVSSKGIAAELNRPIRNVEGKTLHSNLHRVLPTYGFPIFLSIGFGCIGFFYQPVIAFSLAITSASVLLGWRLLWVKLIHGYSGDCVGALIELSETALLLCLVVSYALF